MEACLAQHSQHVSLLANHERRKGMNQIHPVHLEIKRVKCSGRWAGSKLGTVQNNATAKLGKDLVKDRTS